METGNRHNITCCEPMPEISMYGIDKNNKTMIKTKSNDLTTNVYTNKNRIVLPNEMK